MNDTLPREGSRLGPYLLERRLTGADPELGLVYEARHVGTGASALVLVPESTSPWAPRAPWTVCSRAGVTPPFFALEVEHAPGASARALHALTLGLIHLSGALASVEDREDTAAFLTRAPRAAPRAAPRRRARAGALAALAGLALVLGWMWLGPRTPVSATHGEKGPAARHVADELISWTQTAPLPLLGFPLPATPLKGQHKPPCPGRAAVEINGGCWVALAVPSPCDKGYAEHQGKCYMPVREPAPEPRSVEP